VSNPIQSASFTAEPSDQRCRYWAKVVRADQAIPLPSAVAGANDIPGPYIRKGDDVEVFEGDFVLEGEEVHHRKQRGWAYTVRYLRVRKDGDLGVIATQFTFAEVKDACRAAGRKDLLGGSGDCAAMIRAIHAHRDGVVEIKPLADRLAAVQAKLAQAAEVTP
jgi:hypothetical protein